MEQQLKTSTYQEISRRIDDVLKQRISTKYYPLPKKLQQNDIEYIAISE